MKTKLKLIISCSILLTSCSIKKELSIIDGSKSDGTLTLAAEYDGAFIVKVDLQKAKERAQEKCNAWGYKSAELFDAGTTQSIGGGRKRIVYKVQCTD